MADKELEGDDPLEFVAMRFPAPAGVDMDEAMARCFVEEYALMGMPRERVVRMFASQFFAGAHAVYEERGAAFVERIVADVFGPATPVEVH
jgi:hypothetical protein